MRKSDSSVRRADFDGAAGARRENTVRDQRNVRLGQTISSDKAPLRDTWNGTLADDVAANGRVVASGATQ